MTTVSSCSLKTFTTLRLLVRHFNSAQKLIEKHALKRSLRTLDAIQLAVAINLHEYLQIDYFVCADKNLCSIAELEGLSIINPTTSG